jgi:hypothetical protein
LFDGRDVENQLYFSDEVSVRRYLCCYPERLIRLGIGYEIAEAVVYEVEHRSLAAAKLWAMLQISAPVDHYAN